MKHPPVINTQWSIPLMLFRLIKFKVSLVEAAERLPRSKEACRDDWKKKSKEFNVRDTRQKKKETAAATTTTKAATITPTTTRAATRLMAPSFTSAGISYEYCMIQGIPPVNPVASWRFLIDSNSFQLSSARRRRYRRHRRHRRHAAPFNQPGPTEYPQPNNWLIIKKLKSLFDWYWRILRLFVFHSSNSEIVKVSMEIEPPICDKIAGPLFYNSTWLFFFFSFWFCSKGLDMKRTVTVLLYLQSFIDRTPFPWNGILFETIWANLAIQTFETCSADSKIAARISLARSVSPARRWKRRIEPNEIAAFCSIVE